MTFRRVFLAALCAVVSLAVGVSPAGAQTSEPPIPVFPEAGPTPPPPGVIVDTHEPITECSGWYRQDTYGGDAHSLWRSDRTWWEYSCAPAGQFDGCDVWSQDFYYAGENGQPVFYGQWYGYVDGWCGGTWWLWWDEPTNQWYCPYGCPWDANAPPSAAIAVRCSASSCDFDAGASSDSDGIIVAFEWDFGDGGGASGVAVRHTYAGPATYEVTLTVTDDVGDASSTSRAVVITGPNVAPAPAMSSSCVGRACSFAGTPSTDEDGRVVAYDWSFGDGTGAGGETAQHTFDDFGTHAVTLTVTDDDGAAGSTTVSADLIALTASGVKAAGQPRSELAWTASSTIAAAFDVYRNAARIARADGSAYTDGGIPKGRGHYSCEVCSAWSPVCSNEAVVDF